MINQSSSKRRRKATAVLFAAAVSAAALCALLIGPDMSAVQAQSQNTPTPTPITTDDDIYGMARKMPSRRLCGTPTWIRTSIAYLKTAERHRQRQVMPARPQKPKIQSP